MRIGKHRTQSLITYVLVAVLLSFIAVAVYIFLLNSKRRDSYLLSNIQQVENSVKVAISFETSRLKQIAFDYTFWDETVDYVHKRNASWAKDNLDPIITTYSIDFLVIIDTSFNKVYSITRDEYKALQNIFLKDSTLELLRQNRFLDFFYTSEFGVVEVHGATIHYTNDRERITTPQGFFIIGKVLDKSYVNNISLVTGTNIRMDAIPVESRLLKSKQGIAFSIPLLGQDGKELVYYNVEKVYDFFRQYSNFSLQLISVLILSSLFVVITLILVFSFFVNRPLKIVEQILNTNDVSKIDKLQNYGSEFAEIGSLINHTIEQKNTLEVLKNKAEESDRLKSAFLANMSHEIRTPLNAISGFAELLCQNSPNDEESKNYKKIMMNSSGDLLHLINDILDYSKIEAGQLVLKNEQFSLNDLFDELFAIYSKKNINKSITIVYSQLNERINIDSDRQRIRQVMVNLLDNALKFTEKGFVEFGFKTTGSRLEMWVKDSGIGVPENSRDLIFERFQQANKNPTKIYGGAGLGLSICKGLVSLLGGTINYSANASEGSLFTIDIPCVSFKTDNKIKVDEVPVALPNWKGRKLMVV
ncbi:MAG TPA: ATP-binding protein, partial [Tenuifilaceae bacterium]|nr:ATP-binding protein [Tenuifilaceae bacterium]